MGNLRNTGIVREHCGSVCIPIPPPVAYPQCLPKPLHGSSLVTMALAAFGGIFPQSPDIAFSDAQKSPHSI
jgi:hypothetical protein